MAHAEATLQKGITIGDVTHKTVILRDPTALDVVEATAVSERVVMVPAGFDASGNQVHTPQLVVSPTMTAILVVLKQIVSIGPINGPLDKTFLEKLSPEDLNIIQRKAEEMEGATYASDEVAQRGRTDSAGEGAT